MLIVSVFVAIAAGVTAFLLLASGNMKQFRKDFAWRPKKHLPLMTSDGKLIDCKEDLEVQLGVLEDKLNQKKTVIETSKTKASHVADNIEKLSSASVEVRKYYQQLKDEILRSEKECKDLQKQIEDYHVRQAELRAQIKSNDKNFKDLLKNIRGDSNSITELPNTTPSSKVWNGDLTGTQLRISSKESNKLHFECSGATSCTESNTSVTSEEASTSSAESVESSRQHLQCTSKESPTPDYICNYFEELQYEDYQHVDGNCAKGTLGQKQKHCWPVSKEGTSWTYVSQKSFKNTVEQKCKKPSGSNAPKQYCKLRIRLRPKDHCEKSTGKNISNRVVVTKTVQDSSKDSISSQSSRKSTTSNGSGLSCRSRQSFKEFYDERKRVSFDIRPSSAPANPGCCAREKKNSSGNSKRMINTLECVAPQAHVQRNALRNICLVEKSKAEKFAFLSAAQVITVPVLSARGVKPKQKMVAPSNKCNANFACNKKGTQTVNAKPLKSICDNVVSSDSSSCSSSIAHKPCPKDCPRKEYPLLAKFGITVKPAKLSKNANSEGEFAPPIRSRLSYSYR